MLIVKIMKYASFSNLFQTESKILFYISQFQGPSGDRNVECCLQAVERFVMKPQREGGGMIWFTFNSQMERDERNNNNFELRCSLWEVQN